MNKQWSVLWGCMMLVTVPGLVAQVSSDEKPRQEREAGKRKKHERRIHKQRPDKSLKAEAKKDADHKRVKKHKKHERRIHKQRPVQAQVGRHHKRHDKKHEAGKGVKADKRHKTKRHERHIYKQRPSAEKMAAVTAHSKRAAHKPAKKRRKHVGFDLCKEHELSAASCPVNE